ncbi:MAG: nitrogenase cofactor biosynthesis protein NifB [Chloroflexi bacterium]|nr:nitrogenase cofactor biosynthesis protein NifB [Chloroflexota bacterium]
MSKSISTATHSQAVPQDVARRVATHPCYSEEAHHHYVRMHLPVAPKCNIQCNYCNRAYDCLNESRPGVTSKVLTPEQAVERVALVMSQLPQLSVVGIAGPGDPLANPDKTFRTFELIAGRFPDLKACLSTNGLMLPDYVDEIKAHNVDHVTVTMNAVDPAIATEVYRWVFFGGQTLRGREGAELLLSRQLLGLEMLQDHDILCKVNIVMTPGVNDDHIPTLVREVKNRGPFIVNVMPLIPVPGTKFGDERRAPTFEEVRRVRDLCEGDVRQMRHCRQCRADAVGLLGQDRSKEFAQHQGCAVAATLLAEKRQEVMERVSATISEQREEKERVVEDGPLPRVRMAVASKGSGLVNQHFGHASEFLVYETRPEGVKLVEVRDVERFCHGPADCDDDEATRIQKIVAMLIDCQAVLCSRIGREPAAALSQAGIKPIIAYDTIEKAVAEVARGTLQPPDWL